MNLLQMEIKILKNTTQTSFKNAIRAMNFAFHINIQLKNELVIYF